MRKTLKWFARQSPAMIVAMIALFVALSGTAVATTSALITGRQIANNSITGADVKNKSLTGKDFKGSVRGARGAAGPAGPAGPQGAQGAQGPQGPAGAPNPNAVDSDKLDGKDSTEFYAAGSKVADSELLDGVDGASYQRRCQAGGVIAYGLVNGETLGAAYENISPGFTCIGGATFRAKRTGTGVYRIDFGARGVVFIPRLSCGTNVAVATLADGTDTAGVGIEVIDADEPLGGLFGDEACVVDVHTFDADAPGFGGSITPDPVDEIFTIAVVASG